MSTDFQGKLTFWLLIVGLFVEVAIGLIAAVNLHCKKLTKSTKRNLEIVLEWSAFVAAGFVFLAILSEHFLDVRREQEIESIKNSFNRTFSLGQQRGIISRVWTDKPPFRVFLDDTVPDAESFGKEIANVFSKCGFKFNGFIEGVGLPNQRGVFVGGNGIQSQSLNEIADALNWCGFNAKTNQVSPLFTNEVIIQIENR